MHGLVNRAIQQLITSEYGHEVWLKVSGRAGWERGSFVSMDNYDDAVSYALVEAASEELGIGVAEVMEAVGCHWMRSSAQEGYGALLDMVGETFEEFLAHIDDMHARVELSLPGLRPPSFSVRRTGSDSWDLRYCSQRLGFSGMVIGIMHALAERFGTQIEIAWEENGSQAGGADLLFHIKECKARGRSAA